MATLKIKELIQVFAEATGCSIQHGGCPCNRCFHSISADFNHICWLIVLGMRGDYDKTEILKSIKDELAHGLKNNIEDMVSGGEQHGSGE